MTNESPERFYRPFFQIGPSLAYIIHALATELRSIISATCVRFWPQAYEGCPEAGWPAAGEVV